jgi:hypothetical protein
MVGTVLICPDGAERRLGFEECQYGAFIAVEEGAQHEDLDRFGTFSTVVARGDQRWGGRQADLLFDGGVLIEVGTLSPGPVAASGLRQLR